MSDHQPSLLVSYLISTAMYAVAAYTGVMESPVTVAIVALIPLGLVVAGFLYRLRYGCAVLLPPATDDENALVVDGIRAQPYALAIRYLVEVRHLYFLAVVPIYSFLVWAAVATGILHYSHENPFPLWAAMAGLFATGWLGWRWVRERNLVSRGGCTLARIHEVTKSRASYDYFDGRGERHGGCARVFGRVGKAESRVPILMTMIWPANAMIFPSFFFHRFRMADTHHVPESQLMGVKPEA